MKIKLQEILDNRNISVYSLSKEIGVTQNNLGKLVKGETTSIKYDILEKICNILDITPNDIFEIEPSQLNLFNEIETNTKKKTLINEETLDIIYKIKNESIEEFNNYVPSDEELEYLQDRINLEYKLGSNLESIVKYVLDNTDLNNLTSKIKLELKALQKVDTNVPFAFRFILSYRSLYYIVMKQMYNKQLIDFLQNIKRVYVNNNGTLMLSDKELNNLLDESNYILKYFNTKKD